MFPEKPRSGTMEANDPVCILLRAEWRRNTPGEIVGASRRVAITPFGARINPNYAICWRFYSPPHAPGALASRTTCFPRIPRPLRSIVYFSHILLFISNIASKFHTARQDHAGELQPIY